MRAGLFVILLQDTSHDDTVGPRAERSGRRRKATKSSILIPQGHVGLRPSSRQRLPLVSFQAQNVDLGQQEGAH